MYGVTEMGPFEAQLTGLPEAKTLVAGEILFKANWKFGPTAVVARY